jgi:nitrilase
VANSSGYSEKVGLFAVKITLSCSHFPLKVSGEHMSTHTQSLTVAVIQAAPILFNREGTVEKTCDLVQKASEKGAKLILLPEAFIPAYPRGLSFGTVVGNRSPAGRQLWLRYWENAVEVPGPATEILAEAARRAKVYLAIGIIERDTQFSSGTLFCTLLYFGPDGQILGKHRKLKPTAAERLIWGEGDGSTLTVIDTEFGKIGGLICWENYMPLARMVMYNKGVNLYLAPTADARDTWQATLRHIACEGRCFVLGCNQFVTKDMYPSNLEGLHELEDQPDVMCRGGSVIISPLGEILSGPLYGQEGMLLADLDLKEIVRSKFDFDVIGHYARPDIFRLVVNENPIHSVVKGPQGGRDTIR